jgi:hypothetical protein
MDIMNLQNSDRKYMAFDIEIARLLPNDLKDWKAYRPLGITCAATYTSFEEPRLWHGMTPDGELSDQMSQEEAVSMTAYLQSAVADGFTLVTWNGMGFDFDILAEESGMLEACSELAFGHVDMMFHFFCLKGYAIGLDTAAKGMGLAGKTPGMKGDMAPRYWADGRRQEVLEYVAQDVRTTLELANAVEIESKLKWISRSNRPQTARFPDGWLSAREALELPEVDNSWMDNPWKREKFTGWAL